MTDTTTNIVLQILVSVSHLYDEAVADETREGADITDIANARGRQEAYETILALIGDELDGVKTAGIPGQ